MFVGKSRIYHISSWLTVLSSQNRHNGQQETKFPESGWTLLIQTLDYGSAIHSHHEHWTMICMLIRHAHWFSMRYDCGLWFTFQKVNPFVIFDHGFWRDTNWNRRVWTLAETDSPSTVPLCHVCRHTQPSLHLHRQMKLENDHSLVRNIQCHLFRPQSLERLSLSDSKVWRTRGQLFLFWSQWKDMIESVGNIRSKPVSQYSSRVMPTLNFRFWSWSVPKEEQRRAGLLPILHGGDLEQTFLW